MLKIEIIVLKDQISLYKKDIEKLEAIRKEYKQFIQTNSKKKKKNSAISEK